jgi:predicted PurR-regulated permease PerM
MPNSTPPSIVSKHPQFTKIAMWVLLVLLIFWLRSFFLLIFLTFVFSFVQYSLGEKLKQKIRNRRFRTCLIGVSMLILISGTIYFLATEVKIQTKSFIYNFDSYIVAFDRQLNNLAENFPVFGQMLSDIENYANLENSKTISPTLLILQQSFDLPTVENSGNIKKNLSAVMLYSGKLIGIASSFLLSMLFSFLIILDYPRLTRMFGRLERSRIAFVFHEIKPSITQFSAILGRALEAQFFIAVINGLLTGIGLWLLGIGKFSAFLISTVFLCSFVPIAGVFISSVPICMVALQHNGPFLMLMAIGLITMIHAIEAYILNPRIYGSHMHMNPVIILGILTIFGKLFGVWGLILGVPLCSWFFKVVCLQENITQKIPQKT